MDNKRIDAASLAAKLCSHRFRLSCYGCREKLLQLAADEMENKSDVSAAVTAKGSMDSDNVDEENTNGKCLVTGWRVYLPLMLELKADQHSFVPLPTCTDFPSVAEDLAKLGIEKFTNGPKGGVYFKSQRSNAITEETPFPSLRQVRGEYGQPLQRKSTVFFNLSTSNTSRSGTLTSMGTSRTTSGRKNN